MHFLLPLCIHMYWICHRVCPVCKRGASENKALAAFYTNESVCVLYCNLDFGQSPNGASHRRRNKTLTLLEMKWREKENKRGIKNRMKIYRSSFVFGQHIICKVGSLPRFSRWRPSPPLPQSLSKQLRNKTRFVVGQVVWLSLPIALGALGR